MRLAQTALQLQERLRIEPAREDRCALAARYITLVETLLEAGATSRPAACSRCAQVDAPELWRALVLEARWTAIPLLPGRAARVVEVRRCRACHRRLARSLDAC
jgi:hypothetical protein